jgi:hypothetical protein
MLIFGNIGKENGRVTAVKKPWNLLAEIFGTTQTSGMASSYYIFFEKSVIQTTQTARLSCIKVTL